MIHYCYVMFQIFYVGFQDFLFVNIIKNTKKIPQRKNLSCDNYRKIAC